MVAATDAQAVTGKLCSLSEAIREHVTSGASIYVTGFTHLIGFAAAHEIIRQDIRGLRLMRMTPDLVYDQLIAAGCADELLFSYLGNPGVGALAATSDALRSGAVRTRELTHGAFVSALRAGASNAPLAAVEALGTTDLVEQSDLVAFAASPFDGRRFAVVAPLRPDVALVHVQRADRHGNAQVWGSTGEIAVAAFAAERVVVTAEEIVSEETIRSDPSRTLLPAWIVDAVVHEPWASHPSFVQGHYARDNRFYRSWREVGATPESCRGYLDEWVHGVAGRAEYVEKLGDRARALADVGEAWSAPVNYGSLASLARAQEG